MIGARGRASGSGLDATGSTRTMPCATIHLLLADRVLDDWSRWPSAPPLDISRPSIRVAFVHGALAPDMGFVPGVDRFVSELAHYIRPAALTRALMDLAETPREEAFAWGWATHVLGDVQIHPIVGRAVGERLYGDRERRVDAGEDVATHVSTEVGLDIAFLLKNPKVTGPPRDGHSGAIRIRHLAKALHQTYGLPWDSAELLRGHRRAVRLCRFWPHALRTLAIGWAGHRSRTRPRPVRRLASASLWTAARFTADRTPSRGFLSAHPPPGWMLSEVDRALEEFPDRCRDLARDGFGAIPERNLETGGPAGEGLGHPASDAALQKLDGLLRTESPKPSRPLLTQ